MIQADAKERVAAHGSWLITVRDERGEVVHQERRNNMVVKSGLACVAAALGNDLTSLTGVQLNYQELGTGTTAPAFANTGLETPDASTRKLLNSSSHADNVVYVTAFWAAGEATGTWEEFGLFINGTATSNSGSLFNRLLLGAVEVGATNSLSVDGEVTFV
jgi:hypothetical protein